jgi:hypothetical protein
MGCKSTGAWVKVIAQVLSSGKWSAPPSFKLRKKKDLASCIMHSMGQDLHFVAYSFVDYTYLIQSQIKDQTIIFLARHMQVAIYTSYEGGLRATYSALE